MAIRGVLTRSLAHPLELFTSPITNLLPTPLSSSPTSLLTIAMLLTTEIIYFRLYKILTAQRDSIQSLWWAVYVLTAPLLFSSIASLQIALVAVLFITRFVVDCLRVVQGHWVVQVTKSASHERNVWKAGRQREVLGAPLLDEVSTVSNTNGTTTTRRESLS